MNAVAFDVRTAFLVLSLVGAVQALGSWIALRSSVGGPLRRPQKLWVLASVVAALMALVIASRSAPASLPNLLGSHALMLTWLGLCWMALELERGRTPRWSFVIALVWACLAVYGALLATWGEQVATAYPGAIALVGSLLVARQGFALEQGERLSAARLIGVAFSLTAGVLLVRIVSVLSSDVPHTSLTGGASQVLMTAGGICVFVLGNLGYLGLQLQRQSAQRLQAEVLQARAEERDVQAQERIRLLQELVEERDLLISRLQRLDAVQQQAVLAAGLPHEMRQPLGAMRLNLDALARQMSSTGTLSSQLVQELDHDTRRLSVLIEEFLGLIGQAGKPEDQWADAMVAVDVSAVARSAIAAVQPRARLLDAQLQLRGEAQARVPSCPLTLHQVLVILLTNALDAVADLPGDRQIEVELRDLPDELQIRVSDNGPGIAPHMRSHLFQPFASGKTHGLGIGLALAQRLARRCQADLSAQYGPDPLARLPGAVFAVHLPRHWAAPAQEGSLASANRSIDFAQVGG